MVLKACIELYVVSNYILLPVRENDFIGFLIIFKINACATRIVWLSFFLRFCAPFFFVCWLWLEVTNQRNCCKTVVIKNTIHLDRAIWHGCVDGAKLPLRHQGTKLTVCTIYSLQLWCVVLLCEWTLIL